MIRVLKTLLTGNDRALNWALLCAAAAVAVMSIILSLPRPAPVPVDPKPTRSEMPANWQAIAWPGYHFNDDGALCDERNTAIPQAVDMEGWLDKAELGPETTALLGWAATNKAAMSAASGVLVTVNGYWVLLGRPSVSRADVDQALHVASPLTAGFRLVLPMAVQPRDRVRIFAFNSDGGVHELSYNPALPFLTGQK